MQDQCLAQTFGLGLADPPSTVRDWAIDVLGQDSDECTGGRGLVADGADGGCDRAEWEA